MVIDKNNVRKYLPIKGGFISAVVFSLVLFMPVLVTMISVRADGKPMLARLVVAILGQVIFFWVAHEIFPELRAYWSRNVIGYSLRLDNFKQWNIENSWRVWWSDPNFRQNWVPLTEVSVLLYAVCIETNTMLGKKLEQIVEIESKMDKKNCDLNEAYQKLRQEEVRSNDLVVLILNAISRIESVSQRRRGALADEILFSMARRLRVLLPVDHEERKQLDKFDAPLDDEK